jgi:hypothetical protein
MVNLSLLDPYTLNELLLFIMKHWKFGESMNELFASQGCACTIAKYTVHMFIHVSVMSSTRW